MLWYGLVMGNLKNDGSLKPVKTSQRLDRKLRCCYRTLDVMAQATRTYVHIIDERVRAGRTSDSGVRSRGKSQNRCVQVQRQSDHTVGSASLPLRSRRGLLIQV